MKKFKHIETGQVVEVTNPNTYNIYIREGYVEVDEKIKLTKEKKNK